MILNPKTLASFYGFPLFSKGENDGGLINLNWLLQNTWVTNKQRQKYSLSTDYFLPVTGLKWALAQYMVWEGTSAFSTCVLLLIWCHIPSWVKNATLDRLSILLSAWSLLSAWCHPTLKGIHSPLVSEITVVSTVYFPRLECGEFAGCILIGFMREVLSPSLPFPMGTFLNDLIFPLHPLPPLFWGFIRSSA